MEYATRWPGCSAADTTRDLDLHFRSPSKTYVDTLRWMYEAGHLSAAQVGKIAEGAPR
jgi:hypothetical protein